jgi:3-oxoacyl-[acyl-carrier protein] reductase
MFRLEGKVALVTGGSRGIGRATVETLAQLGAHVAINCVRERSLAERLVEELAARQLRAEVVPFDVADTAAVDEAISALAKRHGKLDILVANAGIAIDGLAVRMSDEDFDKMVSINVRGALACARAAIRSMMRMRTGRVVFVSSVIGEMGNAGQTGYAATKSALIGITKSLAREYAARKVTVNAVAPGLVETDMISRLNPSARDAIVAQVPLGRIGCAQDVASAIAFLCSDEAAYITGHVLRVNGGLYI